MGSGTVGNLASTGKGTAKVEAHGEAELTTKGFEKQRPGEQRVVRVLVPVRGMAPMSGPNWLAGSSLRAQG